MLEESLRDWFALFGLPAQFQVDQDLLMQRLIELQLRYHPDRFVQAVDAEQRAAAQISAVLHQAYHTLSKPPKRARYLLEQAGMVFDDARDNTFDADFLMQQMEWHERLDDAEEMPDAYAALLELEQVFADELDALGQAFQTAWQQQDLQTAKAAYLKMRFFERLGEQAKVQLERIEDAS